MKDNEDYWQEMSRLNHEIFMMWAKIWALSVDKENSIEDETINFSPIKDDDEKE